MVEETDRTVVVTPEETIVIEKDPQFDIPPANRPRKVYKGMWGPAELAAFAVALLAMLSVLALYLFYVIPSNRELEFAKAERDRLERERSDAQSKYGNITSTQQRVAELIQSVDQFETNYLPLAVTGRTSLYQRLNSLIVGYGLTNTSGPDYSPLEIGSEQERSTNSEEQRGRDRFLSIFPGVYVTMTVEGPYANIRRFIREIETGREFVLISSVELEPSETRRRPNAEQQPQEETPVAPQDPTRGGFPGMGRFPQPQQAPAARPPQGRTMGDVVSLRLEMAAYFRRNNAAPVLAGSE
ncbi:hypothetical protein [Leptolyngbya sp. 7M]|uniref:hypothetical protein n=1 Tax=Leptolyngbya sp. 7M TaxID=2812896 RepID=UPI001B8BF4D0|nr:hypothetical protein [Leptolyngbya sp. 7M]QYO66707.1 hypothetical protein JVX88_07860 [Leptolyngbya sp. 7M]